MQLPSPLRRWLDRSLRNRVAAVMVLISTVAASVLGAAAFFASERLIERNARATHDAVLSALERQIAQESRTLVNMLDVMAANAFISNALVDSLGRDQYLLPFLRGQEFPGDWAGMLWLVDFQGHPIAGSQGGKAFAYSEAGAVQQALASGRRQVEVIENEGLLLLVVPVVFPPTGSIEGAVVAVVDMAKGFDRSAQAVRGDNCVGIHLQGFDVDFPPGCTASAAEVAIERNLRLPQPLQSLQPKVHLNPPTGDTAATLAICLAGYLVSIVIVFGAVLWASRRISARILDPLEQLTNVADAIVQQDRFDLPVSVRGEDELGRLAESFRHMVSSLQSSQAKLKSEMSLLKSTDEALQKLNDELERRVADRTADLQRTVEHLNETRGQLLEAEKLAALGGLVAGVAHELNTPIGNSLLVASHFRESTLNMHDSIGERIRRSDFERYLDDGVEAMDLVHANLRRAAELISSFKRVAVDQTSATRRSFDLAQVLAENAITMQAASKKLPVRIDLDVADGIEMDSYPGPLGQVVVNLISNAYMHAFDATAEGVIEIRGRRVGDAHVSLVVRDNGCGIPFEDQRHVFEPFFTTKRGDGGSGLGLNIVHSIVTGVLGGRIRLRSTPGKGTAIELELPLEAPCTG